MPEAFPEESEDRQAILIIPPISTRPRTPPEERGETYPPPAPASSMLLLQRLNSEPPCTKMPSVDSPGSARLPLKSDPSSPLSLSGETDD